MTDYIVTLRFQFPAWNEHDGIQFLVVAQTKSEAIKYARARAMSDGHLGSGRGRYSFKAEAS